MTKILSFIKSLIGFSITEREFKDLIRPVAARNSHYLFELIIRKYDPTLDVKYCSLYQKKEFLNEGRGAGILKPNRILSRSNEKIFEKIFFNDSPGLNRNLVIHENAKEYFNLKHILYPEIKEIIKGEKLTVVLFDFLNLERIPEGEEYETLKVTTYNLARYQKEVLVKDEILYDRFNIGKERLIETAIFSKEELLRLDTIVNSTPIYFQHFDLKEDNVFLGNVIIDWDNSGNYHLGADYGVLLLCFYTFKDQEFLDLYMDEIGEYYKQFHLKVSFDIFYVTVLYHFLNLFYGHTTDEEQYQLIQPVIKDLKLKLIKL